MDKDVSIILTEEAVVALTPIAASLPASPTSPLNIHADTHSVGLGSEESLFDLENDTKLEQNLDTFPPLRQLIPTLIAVYLGVFLASLDTTIVATALPSIASSFNALELVAWVAISYLLTENAFQPIFGKSCEVFGRRPTALTACIIFFIASLLCAISWSVIPLILFRALQGMGGSALWSTSSIIIADVTPLKHRGTFLGIMGIIFAIEFLEHLIIFEALSM